MRAGTIVLPLALLLAACGQGGGEAATENQAAGTKAGGAEASGTLASALGQGSPLATLIAAAGMQPVLEGKEPYTVLAPSQQAIQALPAGTLDRLQQPQAKPELTALLRRHILPGTITAADLAKAVESGQGKATLATMAGDPLVVTRQGDAFRIADSNGTSVGLVGNEQVASNGVVHQIDGVLPAPAAPTS